MEWIKYLSDEDIKLFLNELIIIIENKKLEVACKCIESWEATAELNSIPGFKERIVKKFKKIKRRILY